MNKIKVIKSLAKEVIEKKLARIKKSFIGLVGDWDELTRKTIATVLKNTKDPKLLQAAERQIKEETNDQIKSLLKEIIDNNKTNEQAEKKTEEGEQGN